MGTLFYIDISVATAIDECTDWLTKQDLNGGNSPHIREG